jgi:hypothetical protein
MLCPRVRNFHEGTKFTKKKIGCDGGFGGANFAEEWGHTRDWGGCKLGVRGGFSPRRKDAKFGWRASACPRITRMSRIPHATRSSRRRAYTSLLLYSLLSTVYLLTQVDHERHESHESYFSSAAISTPTPPTWWILLKIPAARATEPREYHEQNPDDPGPLAKSTTLMPRSHTQIRSDDVPWQRSRIHVPRVRPNLRTRTHMDRQNAQDKAGQSKLIFTLSK